MGAWGALIMGFFGAVFASLTLHWQWHCSGAVLALPFAVALVIGLVARHILGLPGDGITPSPRAERAIMWSSIGEGLGLFIASNLAINLHRPDLLLPAMALVVGLHFLPIALAAAFRPFLLLGAALILAALAGFVLAAPANGVVAGLSATGALWIAAAIALRRDWRWKQAQATTRATGD
jgi:hypothetical protein